MAGLNAGLNKKFLRIMKGNAVFATVPPQKIAVSDEWLKSLGEPGEMELNVRRERVLAAAEPDVYLTF